MLSIESPARNVVYFRPGKALAERVKMNFKKNQSN